MSLAYEPVPYHFQVPHGVFMAEATSVSVDAQNDNVYVFNRGNHPVLVFDKAGHFLRHFGNPTPFNGTEVCQGIAAGTTRMRWLGCEYQRPHSVKVDHEGNVWLVDDAANCVTKCALNKLS